MLMKPSFTDELIMDCLDKNYNIKVEEIRLLKLGADMNASIYKVETREQQHFFVKLIRNYNEIGIQVIELLQHAGIKQIIPPIRTVQQQLTHQVDNLTVIVYPFIEGQNGFTRALTDQQWMALGQTLRKIHEIKVPSLLQQQLRQETYSSKWREIVRSLYSHIETESYADEIAFKLAAFIKKNRLIIQRLVDGGEKLAEIIKTESPEFVLCHADIHGGNVLMESDHAIYIVDWDDPKMAPKERDLMFIGGGVANVWNNPHEEKFFYQGYGETAINKKILAYYRHERIVEDMAIYGKSLLLSAAGGEDRAELYQHFIDMFEPNGVVEIALRTLWF